MSSTEFLNFLACAPEHVTLEAAFEAGQAAERERHEDDGENAARYRWLISAAYQGVTRNREVLWCIRGLYGKDGQSFDAAIDAAMASEKGGPHETP